MDNKTNVVGKPEVAAGMTTMSPEGVISHGTLAEQREDFDEAMKGEVEMGENLKA